MEFINEQLREYAQHDLAGAKQLWRDNAPGDLPQPACLARQTLAERMAGADWWYRFHGDPVKERLGQREAVQIGKDLKQLASRDLPAAQKLWRQHAPKEFREPDYLSDKVDLPTRLEVDAMFLEHDAHKMLDNAADKYDQARTLRIHESRGEFEKLSKRFDAAFEKHQAGSVDWTEAYAEYNGWDEPEMQNDEPQL